MAGIQWSDDYLEGLSPICCECGESCSGCDGVIKLDEGQVAHFECHKQVVGTFEDYIRDASMRCIECGEFCDGCENVKDVALGMVMHELCYEKVLQRIEQNGDLLPETTVSVRLPGEGQLSARQIAIRRHRELFGKRPSKHRKRRPPQSRNHAAKAADRFVQRRGFRGRGRRGRSPRPDRRFRFRS